MIFDIVERQGLIVWLYTLKHLKSIRKYGHVHYISKKLKYVVLYVDADQAAQTAEQLERYHFVRQVDPSYRADIDMTFKDSIPNRIDPNLKTTIEDKEHDFSIFISDVAASLDLPKKNKTAIISTENHPKESNETKEVKEKTNHQSKEQSTKENPPSSRKSSRSNRRSNRNKKNQTSQAKRESV